MDNSQRLTRDFARAEPQDDKPEAPKPELPKVIKNLPTHLLESREIFLNEQVNQKSASSIIFQLRALASSSKEPITFWINSPGGVVRDGLAVYDVMRELMNEGIIIKTKAYGTAASMGSFLLSAGSPGYRTMLPTARDMTHQPSRGGVRANDDEMQNSAKSISQTRRRLEYHYANFMGIDYSKKKARTLLNAYMGPDVYLTPYLAKRLGLIDNISLQTNSGRPAKGITEEFLKRSVETDIMLDRLEYDEIDSSPGSTDPLRFVKALIEYRENHIAKAKKKIKAAGEKPEADKSPSPV